VEKLCKGTDADFGEKDKIQNSWILKNNNQEESLIVSFETSIYINEIHIYESLNPGSIIKLEMLESRQSKIIQYLFINIFLYIKINGGLCGNEKLLQKNNQILIISSNHY